MLNTLEPSQEDEASNPQTHFMDP